MKKAPLRRIKDYASKVSRRDSVCPGHMPVQRAERHSLESAGQFLL